MAQFEFVAWLVKWILEQEVFDFEWDHGNSTKSLQKHKINSESAEQVFLNKDMLVPLGIQVAQLQMSLALVLWEQISRAKNYP